MYSITNDIERVIDSKYQNSTDTIHDFKLWTDKLPSDQRYEVKQTEQTFNVRIHNKKQKIMSW